MRPSPPPKILRETRNEFSWSQPPFEFQSFIENRVRQPTSHLSPSAALCQGVVPVSLGNRVCGVFGVGGMWTVGKQRNRFITFRWRRQHQYHYGKASRDSGRHEKRGRDGHSGHVAVERNQCANLHRIRRMERDAADQRHRDHRSTACDHQLQPDLHRTRRVGLPVGGGRRNLARSDGESYGFADDSEQPRHVRPELEVRQCHLVYRRGGLERRRGAERHVVDRCALQHHRI
jgi:hypothetical protein